jgi:hypothetical protein
MQRFRQSYVMYFCRAGEAIALVDARTLQRSILFGHPRAAVISCPQMLDRGPR